MIVYLARKIASLVATLFVSSIVIFGATYLAPGDPLAFLLGSRTVSPEAEAALREQYSLDDPFYVRYFSWLGRLLTGDLGPSISHQQPVSALLGGRVESTLMLMAYAAVLVVVLGVGIGLVGALRKGAVDTSLLMLSTVGIALPTFVAAVGLIGLFAVQLGWFPVFGEGEGFADRLHHLTLPAIALAIPSAAYVSRVSRAALREQLNGEHVETARVRGLKESYVVRRHVLRNAMIPITTVSAMVIVGLVSVSVVVEQAFGLNGLGSLLVSSVQTHDFAVVQAICLLYVTAVVAVSTLVDISYTLLDPRVAGGVRT